MAHPAGTSSDRCAPPTPSPRGLVARYAVSEDYHRVLARKLKALTAVLARAGAQAKAFVDTSAVAERALAARAGLGWIGKNTNLLTLRHGSWVFLAEIYTDLPLRPDAPLRKSCGSCARCLEACPTNALVAPYVLDARRCISFLTIELRGEIPLSLRANIGNRVFGCDICQEVCPANLRAGKQMQLLGAPALNLNDLVAMTQEEFAIRFRHTALKRAGLGGLRRNALIALGSGKCD